MARAPPLGAPRTSSQLISPFSKLCSQPTTICDTRLAGVGPWVVAAGQGGWTGRQVIHHLADTHLNLYSRFRLALTENNPTVRPFDEKAWAELPDVAATPITVSLALLASLHQRWVGLLQHLTDAQWQRTFYHPRYDTTLTLDQALVQYAWHGRHHLGHLALLAE
ncbi:MAG: putative metal-dependent hydrolase [Hymenobacter sp.]|nr:MAG: putative metal-dependent hydrolase [Hymenobacter sp.]